MTVLYLTNNIQLAGTARILTSWLRLGRHDGIDGCVAIQQPGELADWLDRERVPRTTSRMPWPSRLWPVPAFREARRLARWAKERGATLVHCNEHDIYPFAVIVARLLRAPIVCHVRFRVDRGFCQWAFGGWRAPDALLWTTKQQRDDCAEAIAGVVAPERQHLIPLGPDPASFETPAAARDELRRRLGLRETDLVIGTATALRPIKRIDQFVRLIAELGLRHPNVVGLIAGGAVPGDEAYRAQIEREIAASGLGPRLRWIGHVEPIASFLHALDLFVSTSVYETFGNSVCEAMICGLPVVAYVGGSVHEIVGDAGVVVTNDDFPRLLEAVERLATSPAARADLGERGRRRVKAEFNPTASFERLRRLYADLDRAHAVPAGRAARSPRAGETTS